MSLHDKSAREKIEIELYRLENVVVKELIPYGLKAERGDCLFQFKDPPSKVYKYHFDLTQLLEIARTVGDDPAVSYDVKVVAGIGFVLQEVIWKDFRRDSLSWHFTWLVAALAGAYPPAPADQRIKEPLKADIKSLLPRPKMFI